MTFYLRSASAIKKFKLIFVSFKIYIFLSTIFELKPKLTWQIYISEGSHLIEHRNRPGLHQDKRDPFLTEMS